MTNEELIRQLNTASVQADDMRLRDFGYLMKTAADKVDELLDIISNLHTLTDMLKDSVPQWISVKERLPKHTATYLVSVGVNYGGEGEHPEVMTALFRPWNPDFFIEYDRSIRGPIVGEVTHWMPLPNPPHERKEE